MVWCSKKTEAREQNSNIQRYSEACFVVTGNKRNHKEAPDISYWMSIRNIL